jgi:hypothetical protein
MSKQLNDNFVNHYDTDCTGLLPGGARTSTKPRLARLNGPYLAPSGDIGLGPVYRFTDARTDAWQQTNYCRQFPPPSASDECLPQPGRQAPDFYARIIASGAYTQGQLNIDIVQRADRRVRQLPKNPEALYERVCGECIPWRQQLRNSLRESSLRGATGPQTCR